MYGGLQMAIGPLAALSVTIVFEPTTLARATWILTRSYSK